MEPGGGLFCGFGMEYTKPRAVGTGRNKWTDENAKHRAAGTEQLDEAKAFRKWGWPQATKKRGIISDSSLGAVDGT